MTDTAHTHRQTDTQAALEDWGASQNDTVGLSSMRREKQQKLEAGELK